MKNLVGKSFGSLFFLFFFLMGSLFAVLLGREIYTKAQPFFWKATTCEILFSQVIDQSSEDSERPYFLEVEYQYSFQGQEYRSNRFTLKKQGYAKYNQLARYVQQWEKDRFVTCYVHPHTPERAVLIRENLWLALFMFIPILFILIGGGGIWGVWFASDDRHQSKTAHIHTADAVQPKGWIFGLVFFFVFFIAGTAVFSALFWNPFLKTQRSRKWPELDCRIVSSHVRTHDSGDDTTYSVDILYAYEYNGKSYQSNQFDFIGGSSSGYSSKKKIVQAYKPQSMKSCFVDPYDPQEAVLNRDVTSLMYVGGSVGALFVLVGLGGMVGSIMNRNKSISDHQKNFITGKNPSVQACFSAQHSKDGLLILKPRSTRLVRFISTTFFALFWNGVIFFVAFHESSQSDFAWINVFKALGRFPLTLFVFVGLLITAGAVYQWLVLFNPEPEIKIPVKKIYVGDHIPVQWSLRGQCDRMQQLNIYLEGREVAIYTRGTSTYTDRKTFYSRSFFSVLDKAQMRQGEFEIIIPENAMHTFASEHNRIEWYLRIEGRIFHWPDVKEEFDLLVHPFPVPIKRNMINE
ncbi:MAG: DUF3592 domain-containing protein [Candidatus Omnitrophica bacterium]|nr:DUF3592 domain-containing protein [Candidatus Omnitrophota bacterium]